MSDASPVYDNHVEPSSHAALADVDEQPAPASGEAAAAAAPAGRGCPGDLNQWQVTDSYELSLFVALQSTLGPPGMPVVIPSMSSVPTSPLCSL